MGECLRHPLPQVSVLDMDSNYLPRGLVLASCGASILASLLRVYRVYLVRRQGPGHLTPRHHHGFLLLVIGQIVMSLSTGISFGVLAFVKGNIWLVFASASVVLGSMIGQV